MFGLDLLSATEIGVLGSAVAGLLGLWPYFGMTDARRAVVAILAIVIGVFVNDNFTFVSWQGLLTEFFTAAVYALVTYKMLLQPLVLPAVQRGLYSAGVKSMKPSK